MENSSFYFDLQEIVSAFMVLFAVIDVTGLLPVFIDFQNKGMKISPIKAAIYSLIAFVAFLFAGNVILQLFQVDISSFAVAGSLVIFVMAIEMIFGVEIFRNDGPGRQHWYLSFFLLLREQDLLPLYCRCELCIVCPIFS